MNAPILRCENVTFAYPGKSLPVVRNISLEVAAGEVLAILGPNGSGKSTLLRMLVGVLRPSSGIVSLFGAPASDLGLRGKKAIRVIFGNRPHIFAELTVHAFLEAYAAMYGRKPDDAAYAERLGIVELRNRIVRTLSLGERMRVELAAALQGSPQAVFLDEPGVGLDQEAKTLLRETITELRRKRVAVILVTHDKDDVAILSPRTLTLEKASSAAGV